MCTRRRTSRRPNPPDCETDRYHSEHNRSDEVARANRAMRLGSCQWSRAKCVGTHRPRDVVQALLAEIAEGNVELARGILLHPHRHADAARFGEGLEARGDIDPVAKNIALVHNDIALVDADPPLKALPWR